MARVKRLIKRRMVADGVIAPTSREPKFTWYYETRDGDCGYVKANTRGEARAAVKRKLSVKQLPNNLFLTKAVPHEDSTGSASAA